VNARAPLAPQTSFRIGGPADVLVLPASAEDIRRVVLVCRDTGTPRLVIGRGTNLLVSDRGVAGVVVKVARAFNRPQRSSRRVAVDAGNSLPGLLKYCAAEGLSGLEFLAGVPGGVGGAVVMNAGAWGKATAERLVRVEGFSREGAMQVIGREELSCAYRRTQLPPGFVITRAEFSLVPSLPDRVQRAMREFMEQRRRTQPLSSPSAGCVFKNPPGERAGRLIERCGLKGLRVGGAQVSLKHANFIVNRGGATAKDVLSLARRVAQRVRRCTGVVLEQEIVVVGRR
jgi:UDP-N-acetylmuramate dehydrogenase